METSKRRDSLFDSNGLPGMSRAPFAATDCKAKEPSYRIDNNHDLNSKPRMRYVTVLPDSTTSKSKEDPEHEDPKSKPPPSPTPTDPHLTILCNHSPHPLTLPRHLLTQNSRLFATLSHDASTTAGGTLHLNIDHETFTVFARWLRGGRIHVPEGDENGFATDLYMLMRAHAAGEALGAGNFADMVVDEIIGELTCDDVDEGGDGDGDDSKSMRSRTRDSRAKARDLEILLQAAAAIWPPGSLGRDLLVDWYVHSPAGDMQNLSAEAVVEIGDLDFAARCMVLGKERQMACELGGGVEVPPYLLDPCRYHEHRRMGLPCYKRSRDSVFSQLEYAVRCGLGGCEDLENDGDDGVLGETMLCEYEACVDQSMEVFLGDEVSLED